MASRSLRAQRQREVKRPPRQGGVEKLPPYVEGGFINDRLGKATTRVRKRGY